MFKKDLKIVIVDYGIGNLLSVSRACEKNGYKPLVSSDPNEILTSDAVILPGVGAFGDAMKSLYDHNLVEVIQECAAQDKYLMGICLGMQLLMSSSEEFGLQKGLNIIPGTCKKFPLVDADSKPIRVPQISWNTIQPHKSDTFEINSPLSNTKADEYMYFVHSYYVIPDQEDNILSTTNYGSVTYCSSLKKNNIFAFQFHPEKSDKAGLSIYKNFFDLINKNG